MLNTLTGILKLIGSASDVLDSVGMDNSMGWQLKVYNRCLQIYIVMLMVGMLAGFVLGSVKLGFSSAINDIIST